MATLFGNDSVLLYDVYPWNNLGFGVPNFGRDNVGTLNRPLHGLMDEVTKIQLFVMTHVDAMRSQPPSINTVKRIAKCCNRVNTVLGGRAKDYPADRLEPGHAMPAPLIWTIRPVPYFNGAMIRNKWMREFNDLCMISLTNAYQHSDNNLALTITQSMAQDIWQYFKEIQILLGTELLGLKLADVIKPDFVFLDTHYAEYHPDRVTVNLEALSSPGAIFSLPTEDDLRVLMQGIPANMILPALKQYPLGPIPGSEGMPGSELPPGAAAFGTDTGAGIGPMVGGVQAHAAGGVSAGGASAAGNPIGPASI